MGSPSTKPKDGHEYPCVCVRIDVHPNDELSAAERHRILKKFQGWIDGIIRGTHGANWKYPRHPCLLYYFLAKEGQAYHEACDATAHVLREIGPLDRTLARDTSRRGNIRILISADCGSVIYSRDLTTHKSPLDCFAEHATIIGEVGRISITERLYQELTDALRKDFVQSSRADALGCDIYRSRECVADDLPVLGRESVEIKKHPATETPRFSFRGHAEESKPEAPERSISNAERRAALLERVGDEIQHCIHKLEDPLGTGGTVLARLAEELGLADESAADLSFVLTGRLLASDLQSVGKMVRFHRGLVGEGESEAADILAAMIDCVIPICMKPEVIENLARQLNAGKRFVTADALGLKVAVEAALAAEAASPAGYKQQIEDNDPEGAYHIRGKFPVPNFPDNKSKTLEILECMFRDLGLPGMPPGARNSTAERKQARIRLLAAAVDGGLKAKQLMEGESSRRFYSAFMMPEDAKNRVACQSAFDEILDHVHNLIIIEIKPSPDTFGADHFLAQCVNTRIKASSDKKRRRR